MTARLPAGNPAVMQGSVIARNGDIRRWHGGGRTDMQTWAVSAMALAVSTAAMAQDAAFYCADLKDLNNHAMSRDRFAPLIGKPGEGNFRETTLPLTGWLNCAFYGTTTYTCDSPGLKTAQDAVQMQSRIAKDILACFAGTWAEAPEQSSGDFLVLHPKLGPASITLSLDQTDKGQIVRLTLFLRRG
jgi:hypothetical protein